VPLRALVSAGNENERRYLMALLEEAGATVTEQLARKSKRRRKPQLFADRGYDSDPLREKIAERGLQPRISKRRTQKTGAKPPSPAGTKQKQRSKAPPDPLGRKRIPIERTFGWATAWRRLQQRWERRIELYLAIVTIVLIVVIVRMLVDY
jgi:transposase